MNREQRKSSYRGYILLGVLYVLIKIGFVSAGYLHPGAILHGFIPSVLTFIAGAFALKECQKPTGTFWHKTMMVLPVLIFIITPIYMFLKEKSEWLAQGRLAILIVYGLLAILQFLLALRALKEIGKQSILI